MRYEIQSQAGVLGVYAAESAARALDAMARDAGYRDHADACAATDADPLDWTESLAAFRRGHIALLVREVES